MCRRVNSLNIIFWSILVLLSFSSGARAGEGRLCGGTFCQGGRYSVREMNRLSDLPDFKASVLSGEFTIEAYFLGVKQCPACPEGAACAWTPCPYFVFSDQPGKPAEEAARNMDRSRDVIAIALREKKYDNGRSSEPNLAVLVAFDKTLPDNLRYPHVLDLRSPGKEFRAGLKYVLTFRSRQLQKISAWKKHPVEKNMQTNPKVK